MRFSYIAARKVLSLLLTLAVFTACVSCKTEHIDCGTDSVVSFTDATGRQININKEPERVAALIGSFADVWLLAGGSLCAAASDAWEDFGLELDQCVNIGGAHSPNLELLVSSSPELVLASASTASNLSMRETLEAML